MSLIVGYAVLLFSHIVMLCLGCIVGLVAANEINHNKEDKNNER